MQLYARRNLSVDLFRHLLFTSDDHELLILTWL